MSETMLCRPRPQIIGGRKSTIEQGENSSIPQKVVSVCEPVLFAAIFGDSDQSFIESSRRSVKYVEHFPPCFLSPFLVNLDNSRIYYDVVICNNLFERIPWDEVWNVYNNIIDNLAYEGYFLVNLTGKISKERITIKPSMDWYYMFATRLTPCFEIAEQIQPFWCFRK